MKKINLKTIILCVVSVFCIIGAILLIRITFKEKPAEEKYKINGIDVTENESILKDKKVSGLDITKQVLYNDNNITKFNGKIENNTNKDYEIKKLFVIFTNDNIKEKVLLMHDRTLKANDTFPINITFDKDMLNTTKIEYVLEN